MGTHAKQGPNRREFLLGGAGVGLGLGLVLSGRLDVLFGGRAGAAVHVADAAGPGQLAADPANRLALPPGFTYKIVARAGVTELETGTKTPGRPDGMGAFAAPGGGTVLVTNHEIKPGEDAVPVPTLALLTYDPACPGGTTSVLLDEAGRRVGEQVSLAGTEDNCAGGITPWGTWLSCEETEARAGRGARQLDHGYVFEVDPFDASANLHPKPIKAFGRFPHEAAVVDPATGDVYLTEDAVHPNGLLYRWIAPAAYVPGAGSLRRLGPTDGVLTAMVARDRSGVVADLSVAQLPGTSYDIEWKVVPDRDAAEHSTRRQFRHEAREVVRKGAEVTRGRKLEGAWWADEGLYFVSSYARGSRDGIVHPHGGQVWYLHPPTGRITLVLRYAPRARSNNVADGPDNITVSPYGGVLIAEDGGGGQHLLGATPMGETFYVARNELQLPSGVYSEFTGPVFSPDRRTLFVNLQIPGITYAITGPWEALAAERNWKSRG